MKWTYAWLNQPRTQISPLKAKLCFEESLIGKATFGLKTC